MTPRPDSAIDRTVAGAAAGPPHPRARHLGPADSTTHGWLVAAVLVVLMVSAAVNGFGLGSEPPASSTLVRQFLYLPVILLTYLLGRRHDLPWRAEWLVVIALALVMLGSAVLIDPGAGLTAGVYAGLGVALPWGIGHALRQRARLAAAAIEHAQQVETTRDAYVLLAEAALRERLAGELHDHVGHDLALLTLLAGRLETSTSGEVRDQAAQLRQTALEATDRLRHYLGSLDPAPMPSPEAEPTSVSAVVERAAHAGMSVRLEGDNRVPTLVRAAVEALTNAARHAPGEVVTIRADDERLTASNTGPGPTGSSAGDTAPDDDAGRPSRGGGRGLGMLRDRVHATGGVVTARRVEDTWVLDVRLGRPR